MSAIKNILRINGGRPGKRDAFRIVILTLLIFVGMGMTCYAHFILHTGIVFSHFFYVPIVLTALWWGRHAVWVGVFLGAWLMALHLLSASEILLTPNLLRFGMFVAVGIVVGSLRERALKIEKATKLAHAELDQIFNVAADAMLVIDKDFNVLRINATFSRLFGISREEATGKKCYAVLRGPRCETPDCALKRILSGQERLEYDVQKEREDGFKIHCIFTGIPIRNSEGDVIGIIEDFKDITERNQLQEKLEAAKTYAENIIANFLDTLIVTNPDGTIRTINQATLDLLEYREEELIGKPVGIIFAEEEEEEEVKPFFTGTLEELVRRGVMRNYELTYVTKSGRRIPMSFNASVMRDEEGKIMGLVAGAKDVSKIKETEAQLRQAQKMEAVGQLAGGVAHDFNNLLTVIRGYAELALLSVPKDEGLYQNLNEIRKAGERAANLTRQLLLFSRRQLMEMTPLDLNRVIQGLSEMLGRLIGEDISLSTALGPEPCTVKGDPGSMEQVIMNLVVNARDAMPDGGKIFVRTENVAVDEEYCKTHRYARPGDFICLSVQDTGVGLDQSIIDRIFEPFFTTKGHGKGTGMGLSVVYGIVKHHQGWINVESSPGKGATFKVYLPALSVKTEEVQESPVPLKELRGRGERILLVEDDKSVRELTEEMLSKNGYIVFAAANAREAMDIFEKEGGDFDLIFCDVVLPDERGPRLADRFLKVKPGIGILFGSGYNGDKSDWRAIREGGYLFLQKPFSLPDLLKGVRETLKKRGD
ncbi:MAG: hypothetical protein B1H11_07335 [Desulfobacteraceae bacterium 4484_190.1]|nr:MAG: hypothetical protein B1H11_07335 [Desulfobacteraceae bacterium 4484_190.1]